MRVVLLITLTVLLANCGNSNKIYTHIPIPESLRGNWEAKNTKVTVRTSPALMKFEFFKDTVDIYIEVGDSSVQGRIGQASFTNAPMRKNSGNPEKNGIAYIIECGYIGKIFPGDPRDSTKVAIWLGPLKDGVMDSELRYTQDGAKFPMAGFNLIQVKE